MKTSSESARRFRAELRRGNWQTFFWESWKKALPHILANAHARARAHARSGNKLIPGSIS